MAQRGGPRTVVALAPVGSFAGDYVQLTVDGVSYEVIVPDGVQPGDEFNVVLPAAESANNDGLEAGGHAAEDGEDGGELGEEETPMRRKSFAVRVDGNGAARRRATTMGGDTIFQVRSKPILIRSRGSNFLSRRGG
jgi:hypothetical protein